MLRRALATYGDPTEESLSLLLGLAPGAHGRPLKDRRRLAADRYDVLPDTFRRHYEHKLLWDIAFVLATEASSGTTVCRDD
jgi:hypothetical protein